MSTPAWSALADRFTTLATEQEFRFTTHPFNGPTAFQDDAERFRLAYAFGGSPSAPASVGIVLGQGSFQSGEFVRLNRYRWLSWAAGLLLGPNPSWSPETHWWRHLREVYQVCIKTDGGTDSETLPDLARLSAEAANRLANSTTTPSPIFASAKFDNWPAIQSNLQLLRERFNAERWHTARPSVAIVAFPDYTLFRAWQQANIDRTAPGPTEPRAWSQRGTVWGEPDAVSGFVDLAIDAGTALPWELSFAPPMFPWFNTISNLHPGPLTRWLEFLYLACPASFTTEDDSPALGSRVARLTTSAFTTSLSALDRIQRLDASKFQREFRLNTVQCNPWFTEADQSAARLAIEAVAKQNVSRKASTAKSVHWTDFPNRVEKFGDLFTIFETFDRDLRADLIDSGSCEKETDASAYEVDFLRRGDELVPHPERIPGWDGLATYAEREFHRPVSLEILRAIRGSASEALDVPSTAVNEMTIAQVVEALDTANRRPAAVTDFHLDNHRWLKVTEIAKLFNLNPGQVTKYADAKTFVTNGKTGHDRRIDVLSVVPWELDRIARQNDSAS